MADGIGGKVQKTAVGILIGLLVIGFAVWGVNDVFTPQSKNAALSVGDVDVSLQDFETDFRRELQARGRESGQQLTNQEAYAQGIHNQILQRELVEAVIALDANDLGIGVNRKTARQVVKEIPSFQDDITGEFSEKKLDEVLNQNRISRTDFEDDIYQSLRRQQTIPAIVKGIEAPRAFADQRYKFMTEQRKATVLTISEKAVPAPKTPDDETLKSYINKNVARYTAPQYRRVTILRIEPIDLTSDIEVTEDQIKASFDYKVELGEIGANETRSIVQITATDEASALKVVERLDAGEDGSAIASGLGLIAPITYTDVEANDIFDPETAKLAFELGEGEAKAILGSLGNWYAVKVTTITEAQKPDYDDLRTAIREDLLKDLAEEKLYDITGEIEDAMTDGLTLEEVSEKVGFGLATIDFIDRSGTTTDGIRLTGDNRIPGIATDEEILIAIFTHDLGYETDLFQTSTNGWASTRVDDIRDEAMRPFETIKDEVTAAWKTEQVDEAINNLMIEMARKAQTGTSLADIAKEYPNGVTLDDIAIVRSNPGQAVGPQVAVGILEGKVGDIKRGRGVLPLTRQIAKITEIVPNNDGLAGEFADMIQEQATTALSSDLQQAYQESILRENPVREYQENVRQTLGITEP